MAEKKNDKKIEDYTEEELIEHNDDLRREEEKKKAEKNSEYDSISDDSKADAISEQLGMELL